MTNGRGQGEDQDKGLHRGQHCQRVGGLVGGGKGVEEEGGALGHKHLPAFLDPPLASLPEDF